MRNFMAVKNRKRKPKSLVEKCRGMMKGMIIEWIDTDINKNVVDPNMTFGHRNPVHRMYSKELFSAGHKWIIYEAKLQWLIEYDVVFDYGSGVDKHGNSIRFFGTFYDLNEFMIEEIKADLRRGDKDKFKHVEFRAECLDTKPAKTELENFEEIQITV